MGLEFQFWRCVLIYWMGFSFHLLDKEEVCHFLGFGALDLSSGRNWVVFLPCSVTKYSWIAKIKTVIDIQLRKHGIANTTVVHGCSSGSVNLVEQWGISVIHNDHPLRNSITNLDVEEIFLLRHAVEDHFGLAVDRMRNKEVGRERFDKYLWFEVCQNQHTSRKKNTADIFSTQYNQEVGISNQSHLKIPMNWPTPSHYQQ